MKIDIIMAYIFTITFMSATIIGVFIYLDRQKEHRYELIEMQNELVEIQNKLEQIKKQIDENLYILKLLNKIEKERKTAVEVDVVRALYNTSKETDYSLEFLLAWSDVESELRSNPKPWRNVKGLLQINYKIWKSPLNLDKDMMKDPYYNITIGIHILEHYKRKTGDIDKALHMYNNGPNGMYNNTKYVPKIRKKIEMYKKIIEDVV